MYLRISLARFLLQLGSFIQSLPVVVMRPDDLIEFSRQTYAKLDDIEAWAEDAIVDSGLSTDELNLLAELPISKGDLLLLGVGGGREAIPLARMGFQVTGVDYVDAMVERAKENAARRGVSMNGLVQEISRLEVPPGAFDLIWLSRAMYSCVPTRARRVAMIHRIASSLKPGGIFICQFHKNPRLRLSRKGWLVRRLIAACTMGNMAFEEGDMLLYNIEFVHAFPSEDAVRSELEEGGLSILCIKSDKKSAQAGLIARKSLSRA